MYFVEPNPTQTLMELHMELEYEEEEEEKEVVPLTSYARAVKRLLSIAINGWGEDRLNP